MAFAIRKPIDPIMKTIEVTKLATESEKPDLEEISAKLDKLPGKYRIETLNWKEFEYKPEVIFSIAYGEKEIFLKYYVKENYIKAEKTETNQMVCEDSCVVFHITRG